MFPKMCRKLPCRNIDVITVSAVGGWDGARPVSAPSAPEAAPWQATASPYTPAASRCVISAQ